MRFTTRALYELEIKIGEPIANFMTDRVKMASFRILTAMCWAGQLHMEKPLTHDQVIDSLKMEDFANAVEACGEALMDALSSGHDIPEEVNPKKK